MSAVGISFGNETCYIAVARAGGIETITNDYSHRGTPSFVSFGPTTRILGSGAQLKFVMNLNNTIAHFKHLLGKPFKDDSCVRAATYMAVSIIEGARGYPAAKVSYLGKDTVFTINEIASMLLTKLKQITESAVHTKVTDCVISVPVFFSDVERMAMLEICKVAKLNAFRLLNETTAVALAYGFYRTDFSDDKPKRVAFVDIGHSSMQASIVEFTQAKLKVLNTEWELTGGRDFDNCLVRHFAEEFKTKYKLDVFTNKRAMIRLMQACERLKKQLSANPHSLPIGIECFMDDKDVSSSLSRDKLEELCGELFNRLETVLERLLTTSNISPDSIVAVELVGGSTRIPALKNMIKKVFGKEPSTTLNLDEAVARGCAIQAAMLSPSIKVRDYSITDCQSYPIQMAWTINKSEPGNVEVFPRNHAVPFSKMLTFCRKGDFVLDAYSSNVAGTQIHIGSYTIKNPHPTPNNETSTVLVKARVNKHGIFGLMSAVTKSEVSKESTNLDQSLEDQMDNKEKGAETNDKDAATTDAPPAEEKKSIFSLKKKKPVEIELHIEAKVPELSETELRQLIANEERMIIEDQSETKRINAKNDVEEFVYEMRGRLSGDLEKYTSQQESDNFQKLLTTTEDWIYDEGEDETEQAYREKLSILKDFAEPLMRRRNEHESRPVLIAEFQNVILEAQKVVVKFSAGGEDNQYSHLEQKEIDEIQKIIDEQGRWLQQKMLQLDKVRFDENPPFLCEDINNHKEQMRKVIAPIVNKPRPKPPPPPAEEVTENSTDKMNCTTETNASDPEVTLPEDTNGTEGMMEE